MKEGAARDILVVPTSVDSDFVRACGDSVEAASHNRAMNKVRVPKPEAMGRAKGSGNKSDILRRGVLNTHTHQFKSC
jgi:hypothetical protein